METAAYAGELAGVIDRIVVRGHEMAGSHPDATGVMGGLDAHPALLNTIAVVLRHQPVSRAQLGRILGYTPPAMVDFLLENNRSAGVVGPDDPIALTPAGRAAADRLVALQDAVMVAAWADRTDAVAEVVATAPWIVSRGLAPDTPDDAVFPLFAEVWERPSEGGRALRLLTALRYWRADTHRAAVAAAGLTPAEAHALNRLWDIHRAVKRVGQGFADPGTGVAGLERRGWAKEGVITPAGVEAREALERDTDVRSGVIHESARAEERDRLLAAVRALAA